MTKREQVRLAAIQKAIKNHQRKMDALILQALEDGLMTEKDVRDLLA